GRFFKLDQVIAFLCREEVVGANGVELGVHPINSANALNQPRRIPWDVVINYYVRAVKVNAFGENFGSDQDAEVILRAKRPGIKIGDDILTHGLKRFPGEEQGFRLDFAADFVSQIFGRFLRLGENDKLAAFQLWSPFQDLPE